MSKKYSKIVYVQLQGEGEGEYLQTNITPDELEDGKVAVYELKEVKNKTTQITVS